MSEVTYEGMFLLDSNRYGANPTGVSGEVLAILVVIVSIVLLGWEMLYLFNVLPIRLTPR